MKRVLPDLLAMGVPYSVFWEDDSDMVNVYIEKARLERDEFNNRSWIQGMYTHQALQSVLGTMFGKKNAKPVEYPQVPLPLYKQKQLTREENSRKLYNQFKAVTSQFNSKKVQEKNKKRFLKE